MDDVMEVRLPNGIVQEIPIESSAMLREIYAWDIYEQMRKLKEGDVVIDVGAHVGIFTLKARAAGASKVIAVEPYSQNVAILQKNIEWNEQFKDLRIVIAQCALLHTCGKAKMYLGKGSGDPSLKLKEGRKEWIGVEIFSLDSLLKDQLGLDHIDFIKIDAEGAEPEILQGGTRTLDQKGLHISLAAYHYKNELAELEEILEASDYEIKIWDKGFFLGGRFIYGTKR